MSKDLQPKHIGVEESSILTCFCLKRQPVEDTELYFCPLKHLFQLGLHYSVYTVF